MISGRLLLSALGIFVLSALHVDFVQASDTGLILGGGAGVSTTRDLGLTTTDELSWNVDDSDFAWEAFAEYQAFRWFALQASYVDLGSVRTSIPPPEPFEDELSTTGWNYSGKVIAPLSRRIGLHGTLGAFVWKERYRSSLSATEPSNHGTALSAGLGMHLGISETLRLEVNATRYFEVGSLFGDYDRDFVRGGLSYMFDLARDPFGT